MFARKHGYRLDSNQEFLALSGANLAAGLGHGFPVSGGMSQSLVNEGGGARTPLSGLVASGIVLVVALFLAGLLRDLPQPVLAAIVLMAVSGLFKLSDLRRLWRFSRTEFAVAVAAILGVLGSGLLRGVLIGVVISLRARSCAARRGRAPRSSAGCPARTTSPTRSGTRRTSGPPTSSSSAPSPPSSTSTSSTFATASSSC